MARLRAWLGGLVLVSCALSYDAAAQTAQTAPQRGVSRQGLDSLRVAIGARVRVSDVESRGWRVGTLGSVDNGRLLLHSKQDESIPTSNLIAVQRSLGHRRLDGGFIGGPIGLVIGGAVGYGIGNSASSSNQPHGSQRSVGIVIGAAAGTALGAVIGAALAPERWKDIFLR
jgi:hypothetical protein